MKPQNFDNHRHFNRMHHGILSPIALITLIIAAVTLYQAWRDGTSTTVALLILLLAFMALLSSLSTRRNDLMLQDRIIRTDENLRHFILAGKPLDSRLTVGQIVALRFASDEEFVHLAAKAAESGLKPKEIKQSVKNWRPDVRRV